MPGKDVDGSGAGAVFSVDVSAEIEESLIIDERGEIGDVDGNGVGQVDPLFAG